MSITSAGTPTNVHSTSATVTGSFGSLTRSAGNLLVAVVTVANSTAATQAPTITSGWTLRASQTNRGAAGTSNVAIFVYTKTAAGTDSAPTFTGTAGGTAASDMYCFVLTGANTSQPIDVVASYASGTTAGTVSAQTATTSGEPANANGYLISVFAQERAAASLTWTTAGTSGDGTTAVTKLLNGNGVSSVLQTYVGALHNPAVHTVQDGGHFSTDTTAFGAGLVLTFKDAEYIPARFIQNVVTADDTFSANPTMVYTVASGVYTSPGNVVVLGVRNGSGDAITAVTDSRGNTWQIDETGSGSNADSNIMSAVMGASTYLRGGDTITVTNAGTGGNTGNTGYAFEVGGLDTTTTSGKTTVLDHGHAATTAAGDTAATAGVAGQGGDFAVTLNAASVALTHTLTTADADSGGTWTEQFGNSTSFVDTAWQLASAPNQYSVTWTIAASHNHDTSIVLYKANQHSVSVNGAVAAVAVAALPGTAAAGTGASITGAVAPVAVDAYAGTATAGVAVSGAAAAVTVDAYPGTVVNAILAEFVQALVSTNVADGIDGDHAVATIDAGLSTTPGNVVIASLRVGSGAHVTGVVDSEGNTWQVDDPGAESSSNVSTCSAVMGESTYLRAGDTITFTVSGTIATGHMCSAIEVANLDTSGGVTTVETFAHAHNAASPATQATSGSAGGEGDFAYSACGPGAATTLTLTTADPDSGGTWTEVSVPAQPSAIDIAYQVASTAAQYSVTWAWGTSNAATNIVLYKVSTGATGATVTGAVAAVSVDAYAGTASGGGTSSGALASIVVDGLAGTASAGTAGSVTGAVAAVVVAALAGTATAGTGASVAGAVATVSAAAYAGIAKGYFFMSNVAFIHSMYGVNPTATAAFFDTPAAFGISTDLTNPDVQDSFTYTSILKYTSYWQFKADVTGVSQTTIDDSITVDPNGSIDGAFEWLMYDTEDWGNPTDPASANFEAQEEVDDPWTYMAEFVTLAHANGFKVILAPARDLGNDPTSVNPKTSGTLDAWYLANDIAQAAAAAGADVVHIQTQADTTNETNFETLWDGALAQANGANPAAWVSAGVSCSDGTAAQMATATLDYAVGANGIWLNYNSVSGDAEQGVDYLLALEGVIPASVDGAVAAVSVDAFPGITTSGVTIAGASAAAVVVGIAGTAEGGGIASGALASNTVAGLAGTATSGVHVPGAVATSTVAGLAGTPSGGATASGALASSTVAALAGSAVAGSNVPGATAAVAVDALAGSASAGGSGTAPGAVAAVTVAALAGSLTSGAALTGAVAATTVAGQVGTASGGASVAGALATVTVAAFAGSATAGSHVPGAVAAVAVAALAGDASAGGSAVVNGAVATVAVAAIAGSAEAGSNVAGAVAANTVAGLAGTPTGAGVAAGAVATVTFEALPGSAVCGSGAPGMVATVTVVANPGDASAGGAGTVDGAFATITIAAQPGTPLAGVAIAGAFAGVVMAALAGAATAGGSVPAAVANVVVSAISGAALGGLPPDPDKASGTAIRISLGGSVNPPSFGGTADTPTHGGDVDIPEIGGKYVPAN